MAEKKAFRELLEPMNRWKSAQHNFDEAGQAIYDCYQKVVPDHVIQICEHPSVETGSNPFWIYLAGLKRFIQAHSRLPVSGALPDMTSFNETYIELQKIYLAKAAEDRSLLANLIHNFCSEK